MRYLYISSDKDGQCVFPCDKHELMLTLKCYPNQKILEKWPGNSHGPAYPMNKYDGTIVLDLQGKTPTQPMTNDEIKKLLDD